MRAASREGGTYGAFYRDMLADARAHNRTDRLPRPNGGRKMARRRRRRNPATHTGVNALTRKILVALWYADAVRARSIDDPRARHAAEAVMLALQRARDLARDLALTIPAA